MRPLKAVVLSSVLSIAVVLCLAGSAMAGTITSVQSSVVMDPDDPGDVLVTSSASQAEPYTTIQVATFMMSAWDGTCSAANYPYPEGTPNGVVEDTNFTTMTGATIDDFTTNFVNQHPNEALCVGTVAWNNEQVVLDAHRIYYNRPYIEYSHEGATNDSITIGLDVTPNGLATSYYVRYFKRQFTTDCYAPDPEDETYALNTASVDITSDLDEVHEVSVDIPGLEKESEYCVRWRAENAAGDETSTYGHFYTLGDVPVLQNNSFSGGIGSVYYSVGVIPGISTSDTSLYIDYFNKEDENCTVPVGGPSSKDISYDGPNGDGLRGFSQINVAGELTGLEPDTAYCVRPRASNYYGPGDYQSYTTIQTLEQEKATVENFKVTPYDDQDYPHAMQFLLDDHGAKAVTGNDSFYEYAVHKTPPADCDAGNYDDGQGTIGGGGYFSGTDFLTIPFEDFEVGQAYCVGIFLESSFGGDYDNEFFFSYFGGTAPELTDVTGAVDHTEITISSKVDPGYQPTMYGVVYFKLSDEEECSAAQDEDFGSLEVGGALELGQTGPQSTSTTLTGLDPNSRYCLRAIASSDLGDADSDQMEFTTGAELDTDPPSTPTNLTASNITQTSATLSWTASTDDVGVARYDVINGDSGLVGSTASTSKSVTLACGQTSQFHVIAFDADNESDKSDTIEITGAACTVAPPAGGTTNPPAEKTCFAPIKPKSITGKNGKKKMSIKLTFKVASDGQSIAASSKVKGTTLTFKVDGKKVTPKKGGVTIAATASKLVVSYKSGSKTKKLTFKATRIGC
jgi:hypothetical protein